MKRRRLQQENSDRQWLHAEVYSPNQTVTFADDSGVPDLWMTQPISLQQHKDPMQPFMPVYPMTGAGGGGLLAGNPNRVQPSSGFIMPSHLRSMSP